MLNALEISAFKIHHRAPASGYLQCEEPDPKVEARPLSIFLNPKVSH